MIPIKSTGVPIVYFDESLLKFSATLVDLSLINFSLDFSEPNYSFSATGGI